MIQRILSSMSSLQIYKLSDLNFAKESGARPRLGWMFLREDDGFLRLRDCDVGE